LKLWHFNTRLPIYIDDNYSFFLLMVGLNERIDIFLVSYIHAFMEV
jgi:hypothetical protein